MNRKNTSVFHALIQVFLLIIALLICSCDNNAESQTEMCSVFWHYNTPSNQIVEQKVKAGSKLSYYIQTPDNPGYSLSGWYKDEDLKKRWSLEKDIISSDTHLYAKWDAQITVITLSNSIGTNLTTSISYGGSSPSFKTDMLKKQGYTIQGFFAGSNTKVLNADGSFAANTIDGYVSDSKWIFLNKSLSLYAKYEITTYSIEYKDQGGSVFSGTHEDSYPMSHVYQETTQLDYPTKSNSPELFMGWYTDSACEGEQYSTLNSYFCVPGETITLYAKWEVPDYLCFTAEENGSTIYLATRGSSYSWTPSLEFSTDKINWESFIPGSTIITLELSGDKVFLRGNNNRLNYSSAYNQFVMTGSIAACGDVVSLLDYTCQVKKIPDYCFYMLFKDCTSLTSAPDISAKYVGISSYEYMFSGCSSLKTPPTSVYASYLEGTSPHYSCRYMFKDCTSLISAPKLPSGVHGWSQYASMFENCTSLRDAPELPSKSFHSGTYSWDDCYYKMFKNCKALEKAPELPATVLSDSCYSSMFEGCSSLISVPELPATELKVGCYSSMFKNCTSLENGPTSIPASVAPKSCCSSMFEGCTSLKTAPSLSAVSLTENCYMNLFKGCTALSSAPELLATIIPTNSCSGMFMNCSSLSYIKTHAKLIESNALTNWVQGVNSEGTFYCLDDTSWEEGVSSCPAGWTINYFDE